MRISKTVAGLLDMGISPSVIREVSRYRWHHTAARLTVSMLGDVTIEGKPKRGLFSWSGTRPAGEHRSYIMAAIALGVPVIDFRGYEGTVIFECDRSPAGLREIMIEYALHGAVVHNLPEA